MKNIELSDEDVIVMYGLIINEMIHLKNKKDLARSNLQVKHYEKEFKKLDRIANKLNNGK